MWGVHTDNQKDRGILMKKLTQQDAVEALSKSQSAVNAYSEGKQEDGDKWMENIRDYMIGLFKEQPEDPENPESQSQE